MLAMDDAAFRAYIAAAPGAEPCDAAICRCRPSRRSTATSSPAVSSWRSSATSGSRRRDVIFGLPDTRLGLSPTSGMSWRLPRLVGEAWARHLLLTGEQIDVDDGRADRAGHARRGRPTRSSGKRWRSRPRSPPSQPVGLRLIREELAASPPAARSTKRSRASSQAELECFRSDGLPGEPYARSPIAGRAAGRADAVTPGAGLSSERPMGSPYERRGLPPIVSAALTLAVLGLAFVVLFEVAAFAGMSPFENGPDSTPRLALAVASAGPSAQPASGSAGAGGASATASTAASAAAARRRPADPLRRIRHPRRARSLRRPHRRRRPRVLRRPRPRRRRLSSPRRLRGRSRWTSIAAATSSPR